MDDNLKKNLLSESIWLRMVYMLLFYVIGHVAIALVLLIAIIQALFSLFTGKPILNLQEFSIGLNRYVYQMICFLTFNADSKPFPFSDWPQVDHAEVVDQKE